LREAAYVGWLDRVQRLLALGANPKADNGRGFFPLERAAVSDRWEVVDPLVRAGAVVDQRDEDAMTPLMLAVWYGGHRTAAELLRLGADPLLCCQKGRQALHYACSEGFRTESEMLMARGGFTTKRDDEGRTPLDIAMGQAHQRGLVSSIASKTPSVELGEILGRWEPWRLHGVARVKKLPDELALEASFEVSAWVQDPLRSLARLDEAREVWLMREEERQMLSEIPQPREEAATKPARM
jgi:hypothetical protein